MKRLFTLSTLFLLFTVGSLSAQTAEEVIDNYLEAIGGKDALSKITSMKITGIAKAQGMDFPIVMYQKAPGKQRMDMVFQGQEITQMAFDGETGWGVNFMTMQTEKWGQEESATMKAEMDFPNPFLNYADRGFSVSLEGEETIEGTECFKIKLIKKPVVVEGKEMENFSYHFLDKESFVLIMLQQFIKSGPMKGTTSQTYFSDYDKAGDVYFAHSIVSKVNGQTTASISFSEIEVNPEIEESLFSFPE